MVFCVAAQTDEDTILYKFVITENIRQQKVNFIQCK